MIFTYEQPFAFVDVETTGGTLGQDRLTEIAIIHYDGHEVSSYQTRINPECHISSFIENLTGISNAMVANAPVFAQVASKIHTLLEGQVFVAHNARFDHGFIKSEFARLGMPFRAPQLCTVKLSRKLYPQYQRHGLDYLVQRHHLQMSARHRAYADAHALLQFWQLLNVQFKAEHLQKTVKELMTIPHLPAHIDNEEVDSIPNRPGVYLLYDDTNQPVFIDRGNRLRQRLLTFFARDQALPPEKSIAAQIRKIEHIQCSGELDALLTEIKMIQQYQPVHNKPIKYGHAGNNLKDWPFRNLAVLHEVHKTHLIRHWHYVGTVQNREELQQFSGEEEGLFSKEIYKILVRQMNRLVAV